MDRTPGDDCSAERYGEMNERRKPVPKNRRWIQASVRSSNAFRWFRRLQAGRRLELRVQRLVGQVVQQCGGRGRVHPGPGNPAEILDHIR